MRWDVEALTGVSAGASTGASTRASRLFNVEGLASSVSIGASGS